MKIHGKDTHGHMDRLQDTFSRAMCAGVQVRINHVHYLSMCPITKKYIKIN